MSLYLVYSFQASYSLNNNFHPAKYKVIYAFNERNHLDDNLLVELAKLVPESSYLDLNFLTLDDLKLYLLRVLEHLNFTQGYLISSQNYNIGLESIRKKEEFKTIFTQFGELVLREDRTPKKGLLSKIFT
jgi:hypothetical protein